MAASRGTPLQGSRSAHDVSTPELHASDIEDGALTVHNPSPVGETGKVPMSDGTNYVLTDVLTPAEHTAIGDGAPHHAAVTLAASADVLLGLTGQQATLDTQVKNTALLGPVTGADAVPTFRTIAAADLPTHTHVAADIDAEASTDGQVLTSDGAGNAAWEDPAEDLGTRQVVVAAVDLAAGALVNLYNDSGTLKARLADCSLGRAADGYIISGVSAGNNATVYLDGFNSSLAGLTVGAMLYLSTIGAVTDTAPTTAGYIVQPIGQALSATKAVYHREHATLLAT